MDRVSAAMASVDRRRYMLRPDGTQVPQTSRPELIGDMLRLLNVSEGSRVLEVGTGSGYSTALLCKLVGDAGRGISLEVDEEMVERAAALLREDRFNNVKVLLGDGRLGYPDDAPYARLVAWASAEGEAPPGPWLEQVAVGGVIVVPLQDRRVLKLRVTSRRGATEEAAIEAGFIPLTTQPIKPWEADEAGGSRGAGRGASGPASHQRQPAAAGMPAAENASVRRR
jgi:protein-L-isoaspartate(D-aspartate) O-methyltransferase